MGDRIISGSTGCGNHHGFAGKSQFHGHMARHHMAGIVRNEFAPHFLQLTLDIVIVKALDEVWLTRGSAGANAGALHINSSEVQRSIRDREPGSGDCQLRRAPNGMRIQLMNVIFRSEILDLGAHMNTVPARIKALDETESATTSQQRAPELLASRANGSRHPDSRNDHSGVCVHGTSTSTCLLTSSTVSSTVRMADNSSSLAWNLNSSSTLTAISRMERESRPSSAT